MLNLVSHPNANNMVPITEYQPLRADEGPYYENINRGSKSAYDYTDALNKIFSYSGSVLVTKPRVGDATAYSVYDIIGINDDTTISVVKPDDVLTTRVGMIMGIYQYTPGDPRYIVVCFSPALNLPEFKAIPGTIGQQLYLEATTKWLTTIPGVTGTVFSIPIARKTGPTSIFWFGIGTTGPEVHKHTVSDITDFSAAIDMTWDKVKNKPLTFPALPHAASHEAGGPDAIKLDELAAPTDVDTLNATPQAHGLMPRLSGDATDMMCGDGQWRKPGAASVPEVTTNAAGLIPKLPGSPSKVFNGAGEWVDISKAPITFGVDDEDFNVDGQFATGKWVTVGSYLLPADKLTCSDGWLYMNGEYNVSYVTAVAGTELLTPDVQGIWKTCPTSDFVAYSKVMHEHNNGWYSSVGGLGLLSKSYQTDVRDVHTFGNIYYDTQNSLVSQNQWPMPFPVSTRGFKLVQPEYLSAPAKTHPSVEVSYVNSGLSISGPYYQRIRRKNGRLTMEVSHDGRYWKVTHDLASLVPTHIGLMTIGGTHVDFFKMSTDPDMKLFS